jgi:hypothetical protein
MAKAKKVSRTTTEYDVILQRRDGKNVAVIAAHTYDVLEDGRGYAGQSVTERQVLIIPLSSLSSLTEGIVRALTYNTTADDEERFDLTTDAERRIGLYSPVNFHAPYATFYTVAEGRIALAAAEVGSVLAHLPGEGEDWRNIIERKEQGSL